MYHVVTFSIVYAGSMWLEVTAVITIREIQHKTRPVFVARGLSDLIIVM